MPGDGLNDWLYEEAAEPEDGCPCGYVSG